MTKNKFRILKIILRSCCEYFQKAKIWGFVEQMSAILRSLVWLLGIIATQKLFDNITGQFSQKQNYRVITVDLALVASLLISQQLLNSLGQYLFSKVSYSNMGKFMTEFQAKLGRLPAIYFEDVTFLDNVEKAKECLEYEKLGYFSSISLKFFTYYTVSFVLIGGYLFRLSPVLLLVIIIAFIPAFIGQIVRAGYFIRLEEQNALLRRKCDYYEKAIVSREYFKETRILGGFQFFNKLFTESLYDLTDKTWKTECKTAAIQIVLNFISFVGLALSIYILFRTTISGKISIGSFASVLASLSQIFTIIDEVVSVHLAEGSEIYGQVMNYYNIMDMEETQGNIFKLEPEKGINMKNVSFNYPNQTVSALDNITLHIRHGETVAIVGENGSGKSTLVRLLTGLYFPTNNGKVEIGGVHTEKINNEVMYGNTSAVFQHYQKYKMTLKENVTISDTKRQAEITEVTEALKKAEFEHESTKIELDTMLSPEFDGIDLSGGQWQKLAIARGLYRIHDIIVLDEPTAAIDPVEEAKLYNKFSILAKNKTAVIVTHRLASTQIADRIIVMDKGNIVETGNHHQLLTQNGKYANMWTAQAQWYQK